LRAFTLAKVRRLAGDERRATAALIVALAELDARRLYLREGCSSLFRYCTQVFTVSAETHQKLPNAQNLLRHSIPAGDAARSLDRALSRLLRELERTKLAATSRPRGAHQMATGSRHIPAAVKREVWSRDAGQCAFVGTAGRCTEGGLLEFHHVMPHADGGPATVSNIELRCRAHNQFEAERSFPPLLAEGCRR